MKATCIKKRQAVSSTVSKSNSTNNTTNETEVKILNEGNSEIIEINEAGKKTKRQLPLVSVIMPVYNAEKYIISSVNSILDQTYQNIELICIDDGSTDLSLSILYGIKNGNNSKNIKIISQKNSGPAAARNKGLENAQGEYIAFVDADDYIDVNTYEILVKDALKKKADIVVYGGHTFPSRITTPDWINQKLSPPVYLYAGAENGKLALLREESAKPFIWLHFIKKEILDQEPKLRFDEKFELGEDQILIFSYFPRAKTVSFIDDKLYHYRLNESGSIMNKYTELKVEKYRIHINLIKRILDFWAENNIADSTGELMTYVVNFLYSDLIKFPLYLQIKFSREIVNTVTECGFKLQMCREWQHDNAMKIANLARQPDINIITLLNDMKYDNQILKNEIKETLSSKTFKCGRLLTRKKNRIDLEWLNCDKTEVIF